MASQKPCDCDATQVGGAFPNWPYMFNRQMTGGEGLTPDQHERARRVFEGPYLNLANLLSIADSYTKTPDDTMKAILDDSLQHAGCDVAKDIFFNSEKWADWGGHRCDDERDNLAIALVAKSMTKVMNFNFNNVTKSYESDQFWQNSIHGTDGIKMGRGLLAEDLMRRGMAYYNNYIDRQDWMRKLEDILSDEVYIIGTVIRQLNSEAALPAKMKFFMLQVYGSSKIDEIANKWKYYASEATVNGVLAFVNDENHLSFVQGWLENGPYDDKVRNACTRAFERRYQVKECIYTTVCYYITHLETTYGKTAAEWINVGYGPKKLGLRTGSGVSDNVTDHVIDDGGGGGDLPVPGCFLAGTMVLLDNNKEVTIEHLQENDNIVGWHGNVGLVSSEKAGVVLESDTMAFGINDDEPFFLACHPFWTQDGWRAVDPGTARKENKWLDVGRLTQGDYVRKIKSNDHGKIEYEWVKVEVIKGKTYPAGTQFYGVHTREGPRSYHANGYLVCQNYPEITIQTVVDGLKNVSFKEQKKVQEQLKKLHPSLSKIMGPGPAKAILALSEKNIDRPLHPSTDTERLYLQDFTLPRLSFTYQHEVAKVGSYSFPAEMAFLKGHFFLDGQYVAAKNMVDESHILWTRPVSGGMWEHGCIKLFQDKYSGKGYLCLTSGENSTNVLQRVGFKVGSHSIFYNHYKGSVISDSEKGTGSSGGTWTKTGEFEMGIDGTSLIAKMSILPNVPVLDDIENSVKLYTDEKNNFVVSLDVPKNWQKLVQYVKFYAIFSWDSSRFDGHCITYDKDAPDNIGETYNWRGVAEQIDNSDQLLDIARKECLKSSMHGKKQITQKIPLGIMAQKMAKVTDDDLSVEELFLLTAPDPTEMHQKTFDRLQKVMKNDMDEGDLNHILGITGKPPLNDVEQDVAKAFPEFFNQRMVNSYLMSSLAQEKIYQHEITNSQVDKLLYYWAGNEHLSKDASYNQANSILARHVYIQLLPRLQDYINSEKGGDEWAKELYDLLTTDDKLQNYASLNNMKDGVEKIYKQSMVLHCLSPNRQPEDPGKSYAADFQAEVLLKRLAMNRDNFSGNQDGEKLMVRMMTDSVRSLVYYCLASARDQDKNQSTKEITNAFREQFQDFAEAYGITIEQIATEGLDQMISMTTQVMHLYFSFNLSPFEKLFQAVHKWQSYNTKYRKAWDCLSSVVCTAFMAVSVLSTAMAFMGWDDIPAEATIVSNADSIYTILTAFASYGPEILHLFDEACTTGSQSFGLIKALIQVKKDPSMLAVYKRLVTDGISAVEGYKLTPNEAFAKAFASSEGKLDVMTSRWSKMFLSAEDMAKSTGVLAGFAGCVLLGYQMHGNFVKGQKNSAK